MKNIFSHLLIVLLAAACSKSNKQNVDSIFVNGYFISMDSTSVPFDAVVVENGKITDVGNTIEILSKYSSDSITDFNGAFIYPGWHDAHAHFWGYGMSLQQVDLVGCNSWTEVIERCKLFYEKNKPDVLLGRGWDQNRWTNKSFPDNDELNKEFPNIPVLLKRVDGHAAIANDFLLSLAGVNTTTKISGGEVIANDKQPSGLLIDNAVDYVTKKLPAHSLQTHIKALLAAQDTCFAYGITTITDAGLPTSTILLIDSLQKAGILKIRLNTMVSIDSASIDYWLNRGVYTSDLLRVGSFKMYADGALGSRGACLIDKYHDANHHGLIITDAKVMEYYIGRVAASNFQLNTHCIGDSANRLLLKMYANALGKSNDKRWRIEHAQVMHPDDYNYYRLYNIIPSVQPTHATSDMYWAKERLGDKRIVHAYAYQNLFQQNRWIPLGTDFPVEQVNPLLTYLAATSRTDVNGFPENGFQKENGLSHWQTLFGMTVWPAKAAFMEHITGDIKIGLSADFVVYEKELNTLNTTDFSSVRPKATYLAGKKVY